MNPPSILITGCSSGIGLCTALTLKKRGYRVFASARKVSDVTQLKAKGLESLQLDLNDTSSMQQALQYILQVTGGTLDALFNNAAYLQAGAIEDLTRDIERAQFETNVFGPMELTRLVLPIMRKQEHGRIIQNSSILGLITLPYYGAYNASKFALEGFSQTLRQELRDTSIYVSMINPGPIVSELRNNAYQHYQQTVQNYPHSLHAKAYKRLEQHYFRPSQIDRKLALKPEAVVKKVIHALESRHPHAHYYVGWPSSSLVFLKRVLPEAVLNWLLTKIQ